jgi:predicted nuclease of predicted toxin-antitoxin system
VNIKLDENLSRHLKDQLLPLGHNVSTAFEEGLLGKVDVDVSAAAKGEDRMVFTLDLDFADLRKFPPGSHPRNYFVQTAEHGANGGQRICREIR